MTIVTPRELHLFPLDAMMRLSVAAGWNQIEADWLRILLLSPGLCFGIEQDDELVASATAYIRPDQTAWIGMVLTLPSHRGRGYARLLLNTLLEELSARGVQTIGLDATAMGAPLYRSLGFVDQFPIERWFRSGESFTTLPGDSIPPQSDPLLASLASDGSALFHPGATCFFRHGYIANYLGPFTANREAAAAQLLHRIPAQASLFWDLFPDHSFASRLASNLGLSPARNLIRMSIGGKLPPPPPQTLAIAGFEYG